MSIYPLGESVSANGVVGFREGRPVVFSVPLVEAVDEEEENKECVDCQVDQRKVLVQFACERLFVHAIQNSLNQ